MLEIEGLTASYGGRRTSAAAVVPWFGARVHRGGIVRTGARTGLRQALGRAT